MSEAVVVLMTAASPEEAERLAQTLVADRLAACVNIVPGVTSVYRWQSRVQRDQEWLLMAKSRRDRLADLVRRVRAIHSYQVPEVIALPIVGGSQAYLHWLDQEVGGGKPAVDQEGTDHA